MYDEVFKFVNSFKIKITTSLESRRVNVFFSLARTALTEANIKHPMDGIYLGYMSSFGVSRVNLN